MAHTSKEKQALLEEKKNRLRELCPPGSTIYTKLNHVSQSGMFRVISLYVMVDNEPINISYIAAPLLEGWSDKHNGCKASGCGMDMGFHLVYNLARQLYPKGIEVDTIVGRKIEKDGGYAIRQRWM